MAEMQRAVRAGGKSKNWWRFVSHDPRLGVMSETEKTVSSPADAPQRIRDRSDLDHGLRCLRLIDPSLREIIDTIETSTGTIPLRLRPAGFAGLAEIVVGQQVSKASATAIFARLVAAVEPLTAHQYLATAEADLIATGLSRAKQATLLSLAENIDRSFLDLDSLTQVPPDEALQQLVQLRGIGPWTAEVFLLFCAGHVDIFPAGDIALQQAMADIHGWEARPDIKTARAFAERWSPVRGVAARVLWAQYAHQRKREDLPV